MKKYLIVMLLILLGVCLNGINIYVGQNQSIQNAINSANSGDVIILTGYNYPLLQALEVDTENLTIKSLNNDPSNCVINGGVSSNLINVTDVESFSLSNINLKNGYELQFTGGIFIGEVGSCKITNCLIEDCSVTSGSGGSAIFSRNSSVSLSSTIITDNTGGVAPIMYICVGDYITSLNIDKSEITENTAAFAGAIYGSSWDGSCAGITYDIRIRGQADVNINETLIVGNTATNYLSGSGVISWSGNNNAHGIGYEDFIINNCTIANNTTAGYEYAIDINRQSSKSLNLSINNCIVDDNANNLLPVYARTKVYYTNITGGFLGIGNLDEDSQFADAANDNYNLTVESPCVDTGDPADDFDNDGTLADMGYNYFYHNYDIKHLHDEYNWISYPRLSQTGTYNGEPYEQAYYSHARPGLLEETQGTLTVDDFDELLGWRGEQIILAYNYIANSWEDTRFTNRLFRQEGYKLGIEVNAPDQVVTIDGTQLTTYEWDLNVNGTYWLGYYPVRPQNIVDAFGSAFASVERVWAEDWYYDKQSIIRGVGAGITPANSTKGKSLEYGKMYIVEMKTSYQNFSWNISGQTQTPIVKSTPTNYEFTTQASYEAIDMLNIPAGITEIGVFEVGVCIGATVVHGNNEQVLAYSNSVNRDLADLDFEFYTGRGNEEICKYSVLNPINGEFEARPLQLRANSYNVISFDRAEQAEESPLPQLSATNYPNPFNPTTEISFSLPNESDVKVEVYNIKGQEIKTLADSKMEQGTHAVIWNGNDSNNKSVSSGIYFYKLTAGKEVVTKRMMLIK